MRKLLAAMMVAGLITGVVSVMPAQAQAPAGTPVAKLDVAKAPVSKIVENAKGKAAFESVFPELAGYLSEIGAMTLTDLIPLAQGVVTEEKIKALQVEFDKIS